MLGFGPVASITPAGSPLGGVSYTLIASAGRYELTGRAAALVKNSVLYAAPGAYELTGFDAQLQVHRVLNAGAGQYALRGYGTVMYHLVFHHGDPEIIRVTPEVTYMRVPWEARDPETMEMSVAGEPKILHVSPENRAIVISAKPNAPIATSDQEGSLEPRPRRN